MYVKERNRIMEVTTQRLTNPWAHYGILAAILVVGIMTLVMQSLMVLPEKDMHMASTPSDGDTTGITIPYKQCPNIGPKRTITIIHNAFVPDTLTVHRCDTVEFLDKDHVLYLPRFGDHPHDITYAGFPQKVLGYNQSELFVTHTSGTFGFHDHLKDQIEGTLIVK